MGAQWIHGVTGNPIVALATQSGLTISVCWNGGGKGICHVVGRYLYVGTERGGGYPYVGRGLEWGLFDM